MTQPLETHYDPNATAGTPPAGGSYTDNLQILSGLPAPSSSLNPSDPTTQTPTGAAGGAAPPSMPPASPTAPAGIPGTAPTSTGARDLRAYAPDNRFQGLFQAFGQDLGNVQGGIKAASSAFQEAARPHRTYAGVGGDETLRKAAYEGQTEARPQGNADYTKAAVDVLGAAYGGPQSLQDSQFNPDVLTQGLQGLQEEAQAGRSQAGAETLLSQREQGDLSPGELSFEAQHLLGTQDYQNQAQEADRAAQAAAGDWQTAQKQAEDLAQARTQEEADIARMAREYLTRQGEGVAQDWAGKVSAAEAENAAKQAAYNQFSKTGNVQDLQALQGAAGDTNLGGFQSETRTAADTAPKLFQSIMDQYPDLKDVPLLDLGISKKGKERYPLPEAYLQAHPELQGAELEKVRARAQERQIALINQGFSPRDEPLAGTAAGNVNSTLMPLYFGDSVGGAYQSPDVRGYVGFTPGMSPSRENVSSQDQRTLYNSIKELLGQLERVADPQEAYRKAQVMADLGKYLQDEKQGIMDRRNTLDEKGKEWAAQVRAARKQYKKLQKKQLWSNISRASMDVSSLGLSEVGRKVPVLSPITRGAESNAGGGTGSSLF